MAVQEPRSRRVEAGYTLVEIVVVVAILGTLAAIAVPSLRAALVQAKATEAFANLEQIKRVLLEYRAETGEFPADKSSTYGSLPPELEGRVSGNPFVGSGYVVMYTRPTTRAGSWEVLLFVRPRSAADRPVLDALVRMMPRKPKTNGRSLFVYPQTDL
jgi:prepilin-type N-terminal cleavage/methylation domain-containing protein